MVLFRKNVLMMIVFAVFALLFVMTDSVYAQRLDIIIDNGDEGYTETGTWHDSTVKGYNESHSRYTNDSAATAKYDPDISVSGDYRVSVYKMTGEGTAPQQKYRIVHNGETEEIMLNTESGSSGWVVLGTFPFSGNGDEYVELSVAAQRATRADAVKIELVSRPSLIIGQPASDIIIDNGDSGYTESGTWQPSSVKGYDGSNSVYTNDNSASVTYDPSFHKPGTYKIYVYKIVHENVNEAHKYTVYHNGQTTEATLDFTIGVSGWEELGTFEFAGSGDEYVKLSRVPGSGVTRADAVKFEPVENAS